MHALAERISTFGRGTILPEWYGREPTLARTTMGVVVLTPLLLFAAFIDERTLNGINVWIKPLKLNIAYR